MSLLEIDNVTLALDDQKVLDQVSARLVEGEVLGLIGPNGAGKSSLLKVMARLWKPDEGSCSLDGVALDKIPDQQLAKQLGYLAQGAPVHWPLTVQRVVELGRLPYQGLMQRLSENDQRAIAHAMQLTEIESLSHRLVTTLSGGERMRVLLARLFASQPKVMLADEPIAALDPYHQLHIMDLLQAHARQGGSVTVVLHDINIAARYCDRILVLDAGRVVGCGAPKEILTPILMKQVYGVEMDRVEIDGNTLLLPRARA